MSSASTKPSRTVLLWGVFALTVVASFLAAGRDLMAQETKARYRQSPYDVLLLKDGMEHPILPLEVRSAEVRRSGDLKVRLLSDPTAEKLVSWSLIDRILLFEVEMLKEANQMVLDKNYDDAFRSYTRLLREYPETPSLDASVQGFLFINAQNQIETGELALAKSTLEELYSRNPSYERGGSSVVEELSGVVSMMLEDLISNKKDYRAGRQLIQSVESAYGQTRLPATAKWKKMLIDMATVRAATLRRQIDNAEFLPARETIRELMLIWPQLPGARELAEEAIRRYPIAVVGVMQRVNDPNPLSIADWAARRAGRLTERSLVEFSTPGPEGGFYTSPFGSVTKSDDYRHLFFQLSTTGRGPRLTAAELSDWLLAMADVDGPHYEKGWASIVDRVVVEGDSLVRVELRKSDVLPEGRLRVLLSQYPPLAKHVDLLRPYTIDSNDDLQVRYVRNKEALVQGVTPPAEIYERYYADVDEALSDLTTGKIDVIDRLFPADAARIQQDATAGIVVKPYSLPTVHFLAVNFDRHEYLKNNAFRQALVRTIPRELILEKLLNGQPLEGCRVVSAPIPAGLKFNDPLAYAYNEEIKSRVYDNGIGKILLSVATGQFEDMAEDKEEEPPELTPIVLAHPEDKIARFACQIIARQLDLIGVEVELKQLGKGMTDDPKREYDLLYVAATISEPVVDINQVVGREGIGRSDDQYVNYYVRRISESKTWREIRLNFENLHQSLAADVTVIPLWQLTEYYAHRPGLYGLDDTIVNLYQDVDNWVLTPNLSDFE